MADIVTDDMAARVAAGGDALPEATLPDSPRRNLSEPIRRTA